jgi:hypothetical protein
MNLKISSTKSDFIKVQINFMKKCKFTAKNKKSAVLVNNLLRIIWKSNFEEPQNFKWNWNIQNLESENGRLKS